MEDVDLIRHAYVLPGSQRLGVGGALLSHVGGLTARRVPVGTWAAADWAIRFYQRNGFELVSASQKNALLETYWGVPDRQNVGGPGQAAVPPTSRRRVRRARGSPPSARS
jgi:hypothetical protein